MDALQREVHLDFQGDRSYTKAMIERVLENVKAGAIKLFSEPEELSRGQQALLSRPPAPRQPITPPANKAPFLRLLCPVDEKARDAADNKSGTESSIGNVQAYPNATGAAPSPIFFSASGSAKA